MSTDLTTTSRQIEDVVSRCGLINNPADAFMSQLALARGVSQLKQILDDEIMKEVISLRGSSLGFKTDRDSKGQPYSVQEVRDAILEGLLKGARIVGNEINIIAGKCYLTKECYRRFLNELEGFSGLQLSFQVPEIHEGYALVGATATWNQDGKMKQVEYLKQAQDMRICVKHDKKYGSHDQAIGKAEKKLLKMIWETVTGHKSIDDSEDIVSPTDASAAIEATSIDSEESRKLTESMCSRIADCETHEELEEINQEKDSARDGSLITNQDWKTVKDNLNSRYRQLFPKKGNESSDHS